MVVVLESAAATGEETNGRIVVMSNLKISN